MNRRSFGMTMLGAGVLTATSQAQNVVVQPGSLKHRVRTGQPVSCNVLMFFRIRDTSCNQRTQAITSLVSVLSPEEDREMRSRSRWLMGCHRVPLQTEIPVVLCVGRDSNEFHWTIGLKGSGDPVHRYRVPEDKKT